jgi:putative acetyltransferase
MSLTLSIRIESISPHDERARDLIARSDALMASLYPPESNHLDGPETLSQPNVLFVGAFLGDELTGCGAVKLLNDDLTYGEMKRIYVLERHRGNGIAITIMNHLENHLRSSGVGIARLEVGVKQPEAIGLYRKLGYVERGPFGTYREDPLSIFMEKNLGAKKEN